MTLPQGALWQRVRQRALDSVPTGSRIDFRAPMTLAAWQAQGAYTISAAQPGKFTLVAQSEDFGGAILADAAFHLDHCLEHQASLMKLLRSGTWHSPAWQLVTFYYWSYFSAMALSRLFGRTVWFVTAEVARQFTTLAPAGAPALTQGTYELICGQPVSAGFREIKLVKRKRRLHEQLWGILFSVLDEIRREVGVGVAPQLEERLFRSIGDSSRILGDDWPSALRNLVNYRPGFGYSAPRFRASIDAFTNLATAGQTIESVIDRLEYGNLQMRVDPDVAKQIKVAAKMLADLTILLNRLAQSLHDEVIERGNVDRRWLNSKRRFSEHQGLVAGGVVWPC